MADFRVTVLELPSCAHLEYVALTLPDWGQKGAYIQRVSYNAFFHSGRHSKNRTPTRLYVAKHADEPHYPMAGVRTVPMASLWDFYRHIGYDWKKKRYG